MQRSWSWDVGLSVWERIVVVVAEDDPRAAGLRESLVGAFRTDLEWARAEVAWHRADLRVVVGNARSGELRVVRLAGEHLVAADHDAFLDRLRGAMDAPGAGPSRPFEVMEDAVALLAGSRLATTADEYDVWGRDPTGRGHYGFVLLAKNGRFPKRSLRDDVIAPLDLLGRCRGEASCWEPSTIFGESLWHAHLWLRDPTRRCIVRVSAERCARRPGYEPVATDTCIVHPIEGDWTTCFASRPTDDHGWCIDRRRLLRFAGSATPRAGDHVELVCEVEP